MEVSRCWDTIVNKFSKTKHLWQCVRGPLAATIAVLIDLNAIPPQPCLLALPKWRSRPLHRRSFPAQPLARASGSVQRPVVERGCKTR
eukprot:3558060-Pyramimonas_sp.AAC.1